MCSTENFFNPVSNRIAMNIKKLIIFFTLVIIFSGIITIFWYQETKYMLPTPVPGNYQPITVGSKVDVAAIAGITHEKPVMLHFFNPDCPCSRFNIDHLRQLITKYKQQINFFAVLQVEDKSGAAERFQEKYKLNIPVIVDSQKKLAIACGVYSTPQAAIIDQNGALYYRGNYNKARYCSSPDSNFAQMAVDSLLAGKQSPVFIELATLSYGCELPEGLSETNVMNFNY